MRRSAPAMSDHCPGTTQWPLRPAVGICGGAILARANARWALPELIKMLDSPYLLNRQFTLIGLERMLEIRLSDYGYEFYMFRDERFEPLKALWAEFVPDRGPYPERATPVEERIHHYEQLIKFTPDSYTGHYELAMILLSKGNADAALKHLRKSVEIRPDFVDGYYRLGLVLSERGSMDLAIRQFRKGLRIDPQRADLHNALGTTLGDHGSLDKAIVHFRRALRIRPEFKEARDNLETALRLTGGQGAGGAGKRPGP